MPKHAVERHHFPAKHDRGREIRRAHHLAIADADSSVAVEWKSRNRMDRIAGLRPNETNNGIIKYCHLSIEQ